MRAPQLDDLTKPYFQQDALDFLAELRTNNNKPWFDDNRKRYEQYVKAPFKAFVNAMQAAIMRYDKHYAPQKPHKISFRISRDVRFSNDKTPYKPHLSVYFSRKGRNRNYPGYYVQIEPTGVLLGAGFYGGLKSKELTPVREYLYDNRGAFHKIIEDKHFRALYAGILGEKNKVLPKALKDKAEEEPYLYNKGWYAMTTYSPALVTSADLLPTLIDGMLVGEPLTDFFPPGAGGVSPDTE